MAALTKRIIAHGGIACTPFPRSDRLFDFEVNYCENKGIYALNLRLNAMSDNQLRNPENPNYVAQEIELLIADNQLDLATKKLMDFAVNFGRYSNFKVEALEIRRNFTQWREEHRSFPDSPRVQENSTKLVSRMGDFLYQVLDMNLNVPSKKTSSVLGACTRSAGKTYARESLTKSAADSTLPFLDMSKQTLEKVHEPNQQLPSYIIANDGLSGGSIDDHPKLRDRFKQKKENFRNNRQTGKDNHLNSVEEGRPNASNIAFYGKNIEKQYRGKTSDFRLFVESLELKFGEITSLVGENGNGKTTLLRIASGQLKETSGEIRYPALLGSKSSNRLDYNRIKQQIAYIPQELPRWSGLLIDNLHFSAAAHGIKGEANEFEVDFILNRLGLEKYRNATWSEISGGFRMRFALAKVLLWNPKIIVLDEPLANLDVNTQMIFLEDLRDIADSLENRKTILLSSQHLHEVESITDNIIFVKDGSAIYNGRLTDFGEDRKENGFEIICDLSRKELLKLLREHISEVTIDVVIYNHYIINTPRSVTSRYILNILSSKDTGVSLFRDISKSTRRLFSHLGA
jgi:ABC-2 type transport system ATP-binding protein